MRRAGPMIFFKAATLALILSGACCTREALANTKEINTQAAASIRWQIDRDHVALGEAVLLTLTRPLRAPGPALNALDLSALAQDFEIRSRTFGSDARQEDLRLELYPLRDGVFLFNLPGKPRGARQIKVSLGSDSMPRVDLRIYAEPAQWVVRQPTRLVMEACHTGALVWQAPQLASHTGLSILPLGEEQANIEREGVRCTAQRWHWSVTPTVEGAQSIVPGMIEAKLYGKSLRYLAPSLKLEAAPIPLWLPQGIAVGAPGVVTYKQETPPQTGQPWEWRWEIEGAYNAQTLRAALTASLRNQPEWLRFPPDIRPLPRSGARPLWEVRLYAVPARHGVFSLPAIRLPWFDHESGQLRYVDVPAESLSARDPMRERIILMAQVAIALALAAGGFALLWRQVRWRWRRRHLMHAVKQSSDFAHLQHSLLSSSPSGQATQAGHTLEAWAGKLQSEWTIQGLDTWLRRFQKARYGLSEAFLRDAKPEEFKELRQALLALLKQARPVRVKAKR